MPYEMSPEEFAQVLPAESNMFASPIPTQSALLHDKFAEVKAIYEKEGTRRSNLAYGYIAPRA